MGRLRATVVRREEREEVVEHLARDPLGNLLLLDTAEKLGRRSAPAELRSELAAVRVDGRIQAVAGLRPSILFDAAADADAVAAFVPLVEMLGVGLVKSGVRAVDALWSELERRAPRRSVLDRFEQASALRRGAGRLVPGRVRPAFAADLEPLVLAARESLREEGRPDPFESDVRHFRRWVKGRLPRARVVEEAGRIVFVGYADVQRRDGWLLQGVYTWPEARGRGHASAGVSAMCREAFEAGADHVQLSVVEDNTAGLALYEKLGFRGFSRLRTILFAHP